ncbi:hypothetical protein [Xanthomonas arboricola]|uniref:hypothetical protein n=1 Tax=Xanthomonas arboricola TaxID=56448 RepID=UPI000E1E6B38|nr:hypothetical protein [Xanthomonas arboricola]
MSALPMPRWVLLLAFTVLLAGCSTFAPTVKISPMTPGKYLALMLMVNVTRTLFHYLNAKV